MSFFKIYCEDDNFPQKNIQALEEAMDGFVDTAEVDKLNPQAMKHVTATLKDIKELTDREASGDAVIRVEFSCPEWTE